MKANIQTVIESLTIEQAREYQKQQNQILWIEYNILDVNEIPATMKNAEMIEDALCDLLDAAH